MDRRVRRAVLMKLMYQWGFHEVGEDEFQARLLLDQMHADEELCEDLKEVFSREREAGTNMTEQDREQMLEKFAGVRRHMAEIDLLLETVTTGWKLDRMAKPDLAILRLAVYEILFDPLIPSKVAINEAVELAKNYGGDKSPAFINGVLGKVVRHVE
ncbi:MAG: transcription antitermination factor NusB [Lachnospiraceae bacterium]|nr:transcription antitermination factor NusB [Lachnospiraceae bacterium]MDY5742320.1 transcription antitermination factor NusB [Lachnospiraceae bacterium]